MRRASSKMTSWSQHRIGACVGAARVVRSTGVQELPLFVENSAWALLPAMKTSRPLFAAAGSARVDAKTGSLA